MTTPESFDQIASIIKVKGDKSEQSMGVSQFVLHEVSELTLILSKVKEEWIPDGISFELFGNEFFMMPDGTISVTEINPGEKDKVYVLDEKLLPIVSSFLSWRVKVLEKISV